MAHYRLILITEQTFVDWRPLQMYIHFAQDILIMQQKQKNKKHPTVNREDTIQTRRRIAD